MNRKILAMASAALSCLTIIFPTQAASANWVRYNGQNARPPTDFYQVKIYSGISGAEITDLFGDITKNLFPGDVKTLSIGLKNNSSRFVTFSLMPNALLGKDAGGIAADFFPSKTPKDALLLNDHISLVISDSATGTQYYSGTLNLPSNIRLARVPPNTLSTLNLTVGIGKDLGNEYQNAFCAVEFTYIVQEDAPGGGGSSGGGGSFDGGGSSGGGGSFDGGGSSGGVNVPTPSATQPLLSFTPETGAPLQPQATPPQPQGAQPLPPDNSGMGTGPKDAPIGTPDYILVPQVPKTGDESNLFIFIAAGAAALVILFAMLKSTFKKEKKQEE